MVSQGCPRASKLPPKSLQNSSKNGLLCPGPPADHQNHHLAPKRLENRRKIDVKAPPAHVEKFAVVVSFRGEDRSCLPGPRGKNCDSDALQRTGSQLSPRPSWKNSREWRPSQNNIALNLHKTHQVLKQKTYLRSHLRTSPKTVPFHNKYLKHARGTLIP